MTATRSTNSRVSTGSTPWNDSQLLDPESSENQQWGQTASLTACYCFAISMVPLPTAKLQSL